MQRWLSMVFLALICLLVDETKCPAHDGIENTDFLLKGGQVFDTATKSFRKNSALAVKDGRFVAFNEDALKFKAAQTVSLNDEHFILPGLVDCHAHYNVRLFRKRREEFTVMPVIYLANGATTTFSCGEYAPEAMVRLRKNIDAGKQLGPNLITSGPYFGRARPSWRGKKPEQEIRDEVDFWVKQGTGGFKAKAIDPDSLRILIEQAHKHGLTVTGHLDSGFRGSVNPRDAIEMGIDRIEHFIGGDAMPESRSAYSSLGGITRDMPEFKKAVQQFVEKKVYFDATLTAYGYFGPPREEFEQWTDERRFFTEYVRDSVKSRKPKKPMKIFDDIYLAKQKTISAYHKAGGLLTMGTDHVSDGNFLPGFGVHREMDAYSRNGIPNEEVLLIATINGARALKIDKHYGSIEKGKIADLCVVRGNPIQQIRNTRNVEFVMRRGKWHKSKDLFDSVTGKLGPESEEDRKDW